MQCELLVLRGRDLDSIRRKAMEISSMPVIKVRTPTFALTPQIERVDVGICAPLNL